MPDYHDETAMISTRKRPIYIGAVAHTVLREERESSYRLPGARIGETVSPALYSADDGGFEAAQALMAIMPLMATIGFTFSNSVI